ncbi:F-box only protein 28 [Aethina tumida]|uniref:F-box only protein 28 n=1 Tax=Aethina tumida TaxID=116153 RepID=UPI00096B0ED7|nr:F-box only protein 28 [Aethina tumida]
MAGNPYILYMPEIALEKIFSFLSYDEIAKNRVVCRKFNEIGSKMLSRGFIQLERKHSTIHKRIKSLLPRRESERRAHPLSRHCEILQAIETRISMLNMTYSKYIEKNLLCFIPGKVLDEIRNVLKLVETDATPPRTHQLLEELRDLSSMAMEHFDEHILPRVKEEMEKRTALAFVSPSTSKSPRFFFAQQFLSDEIYKVKKQSKSHKYHISYLTQNTQKLFQKLRKQNIRLKAQSLKIREQERKIQEQNTKIQEQEATLADIKKHIDEWDQKYADLTTELVRARDDILLKASTAYKFQSTVAQSTLHSTPTVKHHKSNIKPRTTQILPKSYASLLLDLERKRKSNLLPEIPVKLSRASTIDEDIPRSLIKEADKTTKGIIKHDKPGPPKPKPDLQSLISNSIENLKSSLSHIQNRRKRKMSEDIDLK